MRGGKPTGVKRCSLDLKGLVVRKLWLRKGPRGARAARHPRSVDAAITGRTESSQVVDFSFRCHIVDFHFRQIQRKQREPRGHWCSRCGLNLGAFGISGWHGTQFANCGGRARHIVGFKCWRYGSGPLWTHTEITVDQS